MTAGIPGTRSEEAEFAEVLSAVKAGEILPATVSATRSDPVPMPVKSKPKGNTTDTAPHQGLAACVLASVMSGPAFRDPPMPALRAHIETHAVAPAVERSVSEPVAAKRGAPARLVARAGLADQEMPAAAGQPPQPHGASRLSAAADVAGHTPGAPKSRREARAMKAVEPGREPLRPPDLTPAGKQVSGSVASASPEASPRGPQPADAPATATVAASTGTTPDPTTHAQGPAPSRAPAAAVEQSPAPVVESLPNTVSSVYVKPGSVSSPVKITAGAPKAPVAGEFPPADKPVPAFIRPAVKTAADEDGAPTLTLTERAAATLPAGIGGGDGMSAAVGNGGISQGEAGGARNEAGPQSAPRPAAPETGAVDKPSLSILAHGRLQAGDGLPSAGVNAAAPGASPIPAAEVLDHIVQRALIQLKEGASELRIDLKPEALGHVQLSITTENNQIRVSILTEHAAVKQIVEGGLASLKSALMDHGLQVERLDVGVFVAAEQNPEGRRQRRSYDAFPLPRPAVEETTVTAAAAEIETMAAAGWRSSASRIGVFA
jgi:hypothetical protein